MNRPVAAVISFVNRNQAPLRFFGLFAVYFGGLYLVFGLLPGVRSGLIKPYTILLARLVASTVELFGFTAGTQESVVVSPGFSLDIVMGCDGVEASCLFAAGVLAFPTTWRSKLIGLAFGLPLIHLINLARLVGLYFAGMYMPGSFEEFHVYVAQTIVILLSTGILLFWLDRFAAQPRRA
jgi:exosortase H (IPTLxxWG-CTERM-specific)